MTIIGITNLMRYRKNGSKGSLNWRGNSNLPVIIHSRDAAADTLEMMQQHAKGLRGVIHCFSYSKEMAQEYVKMGFHIGVGGVVTFKNSKKLKEVVADIPMEKILLETDSPYLAPAPNRGKRNSSLNIPYIAQEIAQLKGISYDEVVSRTEEKMEEIYLEFEVNI